MVTLSVSGLLQVLSAVSACTVSVLQALSAVSVLQSGQELAVADHCPVLW